MTNIKKAFQFAKAKHKGQRYGDWEYTKHLQDVVSVLERFNHTDKDLIIAGYLHDIIEDTSATFSEIKEKFGIRVASLVNAVTDGPGKTRKQRKARAYSLIPKVPDAILIKLADRIANVENAFKTKSYLLDMYKKEHKDFVKALYIPDQAEEMWNHLQTYILK
jgi:(p)ppGpp synthase/HD superfamily hydrolase